MHAQIAADVQIRYVLTYTPKNQKLDGKWRTITVETSDPTHVIKARKGYTAPLPPPIKPSIELTIRDTNRQLIDVAAEDLVVLEDGIEQKVEVFQEAVAPVSIILVLDESGSMKRAAPMVMESARKFVESLPEQGQARGDAVLGQDGHDRMTSRPSGSGPWMRSSGIRSRVGRRSTTRSSRACSGSRASRAGAPSSC